MMQGARHTALAKAQIVETIDQIIRETTDVNHRLALLMQRNRVARFLDQPVKLLKELIQDTEQDTA